MKLITVMRKSRASTNQRRRLACSEAGSLSTSDSAKGIAALEPASGHGTEFVSDDLIGAVFTDGHSGIVMADWQKRKEQFLHAVCLLQMRVAGENEAVDTKVGVLQHAQLDYLGVAH